MSHGTILLSNTRTSKGHPVYYSSFKPGTLILVRLYNSGLPNPWDCPAREIRLICPPKKDGFISVASISGTDTITRRIDQHSHSSYMGFKRCFVRVLDRKDLLLYMDWNKGKVFELLMRGEDINYADYQ